MNPEFSIVIPVFNEEACLRKTYQCLKDVLDDIGGEYELVFVNDGSTDGSANILKELSAKDSHVRYYSFSRNFGHEAATTCGLRNCRGQVAILIDADLQDPPELIPEMIEKWREGYEVVAGRRTSRDGEGYLKRTTSYAFYRILNFFSEVELPHDVGDFRLVDRKVIDQFNKLDERNRFVRGMFPWIGYRHYYIDYQREPRAGGVSKYNYLKLALLSLDALSSFSLAPLRIAIFLGMIVTILSMIAVIIVVTQKLVFGIDIPGYAFLTVGMFFLGGAQVFFLGVVGEYVGKIYKEVQGRPLYIQEDDSTE